MNRRVDKTEMYIFNKLVGPPISLCSGRVSPSNVADIQMNLFFTFVKKCFNKCLACMNEKSYQPWGKFYEFENFDQCCLRFNLQLKHIF